MLENQIEHIEVSVSLQQTISSEIANHYTIIPKQNNGTSIAFFIDEQKASQIESISKELSLILNKEVYLESKTTALINKSLAIYYRKTDANKTTRLTTGNDFLENLIIEAKDIGASDIHIEVYEDKARVRLRIDGKLLEKNYIEKDNYLELINQVKIKSNLDITEKRLPQDGRIEYTDFDVRVSILPTHHGEKVVMRILGRDASHLDLAQLGFQEDEVKLYIEAVKKSNGIVLISGPTGSGKTTTLYATLKYLNNIERNIVTVEDPIEYTLEGINQVQLKENLGLTFTSALRSFLRQDPDIIMLGEIRDAKTAQMAIRASLTGHLVLSTIHTNSSIGTISRLIDMEVPAFLIAETINVSVAQRLLRLLCKSCKVQNSFNESYLPMSFKVPQKVTTHYIPKGCPECHFTGYKGRKAIYEMLAITPEVAESIKNNTIETINYTDGKRLSDKAFNMFVKGDTSLDEIYPILINA